MAPGLFQECLHGNTSLPEFRYHRKIVLPSDGKPFSLDTSSKSVFGPIGIVTFLPRWGLPGLSAKTPLLVYNVRVNPSLIGELSKPILSLADPVLDRVGKWLGHRKPHLYVHFQLGQLVWCIATESQQNGPPKENHMQAVFWG